MPVVITHNDFTKWYQKVNVLRKQNGVGAATISETSALSGKDVNNATRMTTLIGQINTARNLHTLLQQSAGVLVTTGIAIDNISKEDTYNKINANLLALLKTCINVSCTTVVPVGNNVHSGNEYYTGYNQYTGDNNLTGNNIHSGNTIYY